MAYFSPVFSFIDAGPVVPIQPPNTFEQIIKNLFVSKILFGPIKFSHHPILFVIGFFPVTYWSPVNAWQISIAFDLSLFNSPQVLYATEVEFNVCPPSNFNLTGPKIF
tara:strand:- start:1434 stop:1757 length:324 start_codon:yes stop_codon:yes gene_type:complete